MDQGHNIAEHSISARERALQEKIARLERKLESYESEIDIIDNQRQKLEERVISMESVLETTKKEVLDKEIAKNDLAEKLNSMTQQSEQYKSLFTAERNKNKYSIERLETIMSTVEAEMVTRKEFQGFLNNEIRMSQGSHSGLPIVTAHPKFCSRPDQSKPTFESTPVSSRQMSALRTAKPLAAPSIKGPLKIDSSFFAGLGTSNSPEKRVEQADEEHVVASPTSPATPVRVRHDSSTSYTEDIHFEPLIPLPEQIEVQTGEEDEEVMFSCRAKLYRYDKDVSAWKERGIGTLKILYNSDKGRSRILMRREVVHKICANHFITADMMLTEKKGTANAWIWNTFADYSEEVSKPEQLAVKFKTQDEFLLFKEKFEQCQKTSKKDASKVQGTATGTSEKSSNLMAKFAPKPGSWSCSVCLVSNEERTTVCVACGAAKLSDGATSSLTEAPKSGFQSTTSGASNTGFSVLQGNPPSEGPFKFEKSGAETLNTSSGNSPFTFGTSDAGTLNTNSSNSPFTFGKSDSPFTFGKIDEATLNISLTSSPFTFGAPPSDEDAVSDTESSEMPSTSKPPTIQPFVLAAFGIPAIASQSNPSTFTFGSSGMNGSSPFSFSMAEKPVSENVSSAGETSAFGGGTPEQAVTPNISQELQFTENQPQPSFSFGTPTSNQEIPEQKLFWQQATGETTSWAEGVKAWHQATPPFMDSAKAQPQTAPQTSQLSSQPFTLPPQGAFTSNSRSKVNFYGSELLRRLVATKQQQDSDNQESQAGGYDFTPYVVDEPGEETTLQGAAKPISTVIVEVCDNDDDEAIIDEYEESTDDSLSYTTTEGEDGEEEIEASLVPSSSKPQTQSSFSSSQGKVLTAPVKPVPIHSTQVENVGPANLPTHITGRRFLTVRSPLKGSKKQDDEDCVLVYEVRVSMADRDKASRLLLPSNFFNYRKYEACPGCFGCRGIVRKKETANLSNTEGKDKKDKPISITPEESGSVSHVFGQSSIVGQLTFSSVKPKEGDAFPPSQKDSYKPFQGAGMQLFAEPCEDVEGQDNDKFHFEPVIPLPDEIQVVTGEEGLEVLFSERAKLYRFDADSGQWKERGVGDIKLLRHPTSSQGRVLMRREQIKKLCANHNINAGMELKPNIGSDRSWVWYTPADYSEGEARPEKLAIKFKSAEIAGKFKEVFNDLKETLSSEICPETEPTENEQGAGCALYNEFISTFAAAPDTWTCELCYVQNNAEDSKCIACDSVKTVVGSLEPAEEKSEFTATTINPSAIESIEPSTFQDLHEESTPATSIFQSPSVKGWSSSQLFTIGRGESSEDEADDEIYLSPGKLGITPPKKPSTPLSHDSALTDLPFGTNTPAKFTFSLMVSPGSPSPWKPMQLFSEPSLGEDVEGQDNDKLHFEPVIPLPDKIQVVTGEEGLEVLFSERAKLYRFDADSGQWKERGVGDIKLLRHPTSSQGRVLMRREQIKKLCANHNINAGMELKPNVGSDRSWVWYTPADYSEGEARPEKLAIKLKSAEIAGKFKEVFNDLKETLSSEICPETYTYEDQQRDGCALYNQFISTFAAAPDTWTCKLCYVKNNAEDSKCIACDSVKTVVGSLEPAEEKMEFAATTTYPSVVESIEPNTFQDINKESIPAVTIFQSPCVKGWTSSQLFTIGRRESSEDKADDEIYLSPGTLGITPPQKPSTPLSHDSALTDLSFGTNTPAKFTFSLMASPGSPSPWKPMQLFSEPSQASTPLSHDSALEVKEDLPTKFKAAEGSWECDICMVRNDSDKNECAACGSLKPGAEPRQDQKKDVRPSFSLGSAALSSGTVLGSGSGASSSGTGISLGPVTSSSGTGLRLGSGASSSGTGLRLGSGASPSGTGLRLGSGASSSGTGISLGSTGTSKGDAKPFFSFGSLNQTPNSSSGIPFSFGSLQQGGNIRVQSEESAGSTLFASQASTDHNESAEDDHEGTHFEPVIPLPDKIDVKTGEEDDEVMFSHRAKLYRFVAEDKQWKERGIGDIKLLRNNQTGKMRVLMRRAQVLKLCANHQITSDMKLQPNAGSEKSWVWSTLADFSEQECKAQRLAVRFKSEVIAKQFKETFEECQEMLKNQTSVKPNQDKQGHKEVKEDLLTKFKAAEGIWKCDICMVRNDSDTVECAACGSLKPGAEPSKEQKKHVKPLFSFGSGASKSGATFSFGSTGTSKGNAKPFFPFGSLNQTPNSSSAVSFNFGSLQQGGNISVQTEESKKGGWECDICMVRNDSDSVECAACGSLKTGAIKTKPRTK